MLDKWLGGDCKLLALLVRFTTVPTTVPTIYNCTEKPIQWEPRHMRLDLFFIWHVSVFCGRRSRLTGRLSSIGPFTAKGEIWINGNSEKISIGKP